MPEIRITVREKIARAAVYTMICGNSDYTAVFDLDAEWDAYDEKTAYFAFCRSGHRSIEQVAFTGSSCTVPLLHGIDFVEIGLSAGNISTTAPVRVPCARCITDIPSVRAEPATDVYNELMEMLATGREPDIPILLSGSYITAADGAYLTASDGAYLTTRGE